jgi:Phosphotransferase enzyme family
MANPWGRFRSLRSGGTGEIAPRATRPDAFLRCGRWALALTGPDRHRWSFCAGGPSVHAVAACWWRGGVPGVRGDRAGRFESRAAYPPSASGSSPTQTTGTSTPWSAGRHLLPCRIADRFAGLAAFVATLPAAPPVERLTAVLASRPAGRLVHLDVRASNLRCAGGAVRNLLDWSNALIGDPAMELGRLAEYALLPQIRARLRGGAGRLRGAGSG